MQDIESAVHEGMFVGLFFFFQAEDGIRDHCVTGVQTCALPIWWLQCRLGAGFGFGGRGSGLGGW